MLSDDAAAAVAAGELVTSAVVDVGAPTASATPSSAAVAVGAYPPAGVVVVVVADVSTSLGPTEAAAGNAVWKPSSMNPNVRGFVTVATVLKPPVGGAPVGGGMKNAPLTDTASEAGVEVVGLGTGSS